MPYKQVLETYRGDVEGLLKQDTTTRNFLAIDRMLQDIIQDEELHQFMKVTGMSYAPLLLHYPEVPKVSLSQDSTIVIRPLAAYTGTVLYVMEDVNTQGAPINREHLRRYKDFISNEGKVLVCLSHNNEVRGLAVGDFLANCYRMDWFKDATPETIDKTLSEALKLSAMRFLGAKPGHGSSPPGPGLCSLNLGPDHNRNPPGSTTC